MAAPRHESSTLPRAARLPTHVVSRTFVHETVVLNLETGKYHGLNRTGGRMLEVVTSAATVGDAVATLAAEYDVPAERMARDLDEFCAELAARGLIELSGNGHA